MTQPSGGVRTVSQRRYGNNGVNRGTRSLVPRHEKGAKSKRGGFYKGPHGITKWFAEGASVPAGWTSLSD